MLKIFNGSQQKSLLASQLNFHCGAPERIATIETSNANHTNETGITFLGGGVGAGKASKCGKYRGTVGDCKMYSYNLINH